MGFLSNLFKGLFGGASSSSSRPRVDEAQGRQNIEDAVRAVFAEGYEIRTHVSVNTIGEYDTTYSYDYVAYDMEGNAKAAILIIPHNGKGNKSFYNAKKACEDHNIPFIHFYEHMWNEREYVENRIRNSL